MATETDALFAGRFRLGNLLGTGGSSSVFASVDTRTGRSIALKIVHPHLSRSDQAQEAFFAEAQSTTRLRHPNIAQVIDVGVHDTGEGPQAWIALELVPGVTLAEHVERNGALDPRQALTIVTAVLRALEAAHAMGLIHRDVSPANIMVDAGSGAEVSIGDVQLLDFGLADAAGRPVLGTDVLRSSADIAHRRGEATVPGEPSAAGVLGSVNYMSPEQARGEAVDERGDLYQLGCVLYFALTGHPPFRRDSAAAVMRAHVQAVPPVPSVLRSGIPRVVDRIVVKALLKGPEARFQTAAEMATAIRDVTTSGAVGRTGKSVAGAAERTRVLGQVEAAVTMLIPATATVALTSQSGASPECPRDGERSLGQGPEAEVADPVEPQRSSSGRTRGTGRAWLAAMLIVVGGAVAWVAASAESAPASIAITSSSPTPVPNPSATPAGVVPATPTVTVRMPEVALLSLESARAALAAAGLEVGMITAQDSAQAADTVLESLPAAGARIEPGRTVDLIVASGSNTIPSVRGFTRAAAVAALEESGFTALTESRTDSVATPGTVLESFPTASAGLILGAQVTLFLAVPAASATEAPPTPAATPGPVPSPSASVPPGATPAPTVVPATR